MTPELITVGISIMLLFGAGMAYLLRQVDIMERRIMIVVEAQYARQVDLARLEERVSSINVHLVRIESKLDRLLGDE